MRLVPAKQSYNDYIEKRRKKVMSETLASHLA